MAVRDHRHIDVLLVDPIDCEQCGAIVPKKGERAGEVLAQRRLIIKTPTRETLHGIRDPAEVAVDPRTRHVQRAGTVTVVVGDARGFRVQAVAAEPVAIGVGPKRMARR